MSLAVAQHDIDIDARAVRHRRTPLWRRLLARPTAVVALAVLLTVALAAMLAPVLAPYPPEELATGPLQSGPIAGHLFGTDELGRDLLSRTIYAGRLALGLVIAATAVAMLGGTLWAAVAAIVGGWVDDVLMRVVDATIAIPVLLLALILVAAFGASTTSLAVVLGIVYMPTTARVARSAFLGELHQDYVKAARAYGTGVVRLLWTELLPNVLPTLLVQAAFVAAGVLLTEAALSFLGVGIQPPDASWGTLILQGYANIINSPTAIVFPGLVVFATVWALSSLGDHLQALLDPRGITGRGRQS